jgi:hypothetical protein
MKNIIYYLLVITCLIFTACNEWLDVQPKTEFKQNKMFETEQGFEATLIGVYINLTKNDIYGEHLTMGAIEYLAQHWKTTSSNSMEAFLVKYDYKNTTVKDIMSGIYAKMYNVIANINLILEHIDAKKNIFSKNRYELIKGEALAIRAYCHFDILRLFGSVPSATTIGMNIPYVKTLSKEFHPLHSYTEFTRFIQDDLSEAEKYLKKADPIMVGNNDIKEEREARMNYYAVLGTKARFYLWIQKKDSAYKYAKKIIENNNFKLGKENDLKNKDYLFAREHILKLSISQFNKIGHHFKFEVYNGNYLHKTNFIKEQVFENKSTDIRYHFLWYKNKTKTESTIKKYKLKDKNQTSGDIPLMRLYEMYLIAIESAPTLAESNMLFKKICKTRGLNAINLLNEDIKQQELIKEYRKEFYAEGLMFYTYKRLFVKKILGRNKEMTEKNYVIPLPDTEIIKN